MALVALDRHRVVHPRGLVCWNGVTVAVIALAGAACAHRVAGTRASTDDWESRFIPAGACRVRVSSGPPGPDPGGPGTLVVRVAGFDTTQPIGGAQVTLWPLGVRPMPGGPAASPDTSAKRVFASLRPGRYALVSRRIGYYARTDTVTARAAATDTLGVSLEAFDDGYRNVHNCRPHRFRRAGESACVTDSAATSAAIDRAREYASAAGRRGFHLPAGDTLPVPVIVRDERLCDRAGRAYGGRDSPPRRVVVVAIGDLFVVYDPLEPIAAGEWNVTMVFDRRWRPLIGVAG